MAAGKSRNIKAKETKSDHNDHIQQRDKVHDEFNTDSVLEGRKATR